MASRTSLLAIVVAASLAGCAPAVREQAPVLQPGAPGEATRTLAPEEVSGIRHPGFTAADVAFMQGMIGHHAQALEMTGLLETRTDRDAMKSLAERIAVSQADEIQMMREWLADRGAEVPSEHAHHAHDAKLMPGMLTPEVIAELAAA